MRGRAHVVQGRTAGNQYNWRVSRGQNWKDCSGIRVRGVVAGQWSSAQAVISGVVRDASGAVLPGVTVEAASPALIEKVRTTVTDGTGQYAIENLRPGVYTVTFTLPGFRHRAARRRRTVGQLHRSHQRRPPRRYDRRNNHGHWRDAGGRRVQHPPAAGDGSRNPGCAAQLRAQDRIRCADSRRGLPASGRRRRGGQGRDRQHGCPRRQVGRCRDHPERNDDRHVRDRRGDCDHLPEPDGPGGDDDQHGFQRRRVARRRRAHQLHAARRRQRLQPGSCSGPTRLASGRRTI